jgi:hypothetical protein
LIWGALSDERTGLSFTMYNVQYTIYFTVSDLRLSQLGGPGPCIYIPQEQGGLVIPPGTGYPFRCIFLLYNLGSDLMENKYCCRFNLATDCISKDSIPVDMCLLSRCLAADGF